MHGKVLDAAEGKSTAGTKVIMFSQNKPLSDNQRWVLDPEPSFQDGQYFRIISAMNRNLVSEKLSDVYVFSICHVLLHSSPVGLL